jgi:hypothetical protein
VAPVTLAARVKGRFQHHCRRQGTPIEFSRKVSVRSLGDPALVEVEACIRSQAGNGALADERPRDLLAALTVDDSEVDLISANRDPQWPLLV